MNTYSIYKHTCPNGKVYIGITKQDATKRWNNGHGYDTQVFGRAVKKYGWRNIKHDVLMDGLTLDMANIWEQALIAQYKSNDPQYGYNQTLGGDGSLGHKVSDEFREANSKRVKAMWENPEMRKKLETHLKELCETNRGRKRPLEATARTIALTSKKIDQYSLDGQFIATHSSAMNAARSVGVKDNSGIVRCCKKKGLCAYGYIWRYAGEPLDYNHYLEGNRKWKQGMAQRCYDNMKKNHKAVIQMTLAEEEIARYESMAEASRVTGIRSTGIGCACRKIGHTAGGFKWKFE